MLVSYVKYPLSIIQQTKKNTYVKYSLSIINYQRSYIQIYTYINLQKSQLRNRIDNN